MLTPKRLVKWATAIAVAILIVYVALEQIVI